MDSLSFLSISIQAGGKYGKIFYKLNNFLASKW